MLSLLFAFGVTLSVVILLITVFARHALRFTTFPAVLLFAALLHLTLGITSAHVVLVRKRANTTTTKGIIRTFNRFLINNGFTVNVIIFIVLIVVGFVIVAGNTKHVTRINTHFILSNVPNGRVTVSTSLGTKLVNRSRTGGHHSRIARRTSFCNSVSKTDGFIHNSTVTKVLVVIVGIINKLLINILRRNVDVKRTTRDCALLAVNSNLITRVPTLIVSATTKIVIAHIDASRSINRRVIGRLFDGPDIVLLDTTILNLLNLIPKVPGLMFLLFATKLLKLT